MTRREFIDDVTTWGELILFCSEEGCDICENIYTEEDKDSYINDYLTDMVERAGYDWRTLYSMLEDIPSGDDWYYMDEYDGEFRYADDDVFDDHKRDMLEWMDDCDRWDEDVDEELELEEEYIEDEEDLVPVEDEDISICDLLTVCSSTLQKIEELQKEKQSQKEHVKETEEDEDPNYDVVKFFF